MDYALVAMIYAIHGLGNKLELFQNEDATEVLSVLPLPQYDRDLDHELFFEFR